MTMDEYMKINHRFGSVFRSISGKRAVSSSYGVNVSSHNFQGVRVTEIGPTPPIFTYDARYQSLDDQHIITTYEHDIDVSCIRIQLMPAEMVVSADMYM